MTKIKNFFEKSNVIKQKKLILYLNVYGMEYMPLTCQTSLRQFENMKCKACKMYSWTL